MVCIIAVPSIFNVAPRGNTKEQTAAEDQFNPNSLTILNNCYIEDGVEFNMDDRYQFLRTGYFCLDKDSTAEKMVFNRTVGLKDSYKPATN